MATAAVPWWDTRGAQGPSPLPRVETGKALNRRSLAFLTDDIDGSMHCRGTGQKIVVRGAHHTQRALLWSASAYTQQSPLRRVDHPAAKRVSDLLQNNEDLFVTGTFAISRRS